MGQRIEAGFVGVGGAGTEAHEAIPDCNAAGVGLEIEKSGDGFAIAQHGGAGGGILIIGIGGRYGSGDLGGGLKSDCLTGGDEAAQHFEFGHSIKTFFELIRILVQPST